MKVLLFTLLLLPLLFAQSLDLEFPNTNGTILKKNKDYSIRVIDTGLESAMQVEAKFILNGPKKYCIYIVTNITTYPEFMPNFYKTKLLPKDIWDIQLQVLVFEIKYKMKNVYGHENGWDTVYWKYLKGDFKTTRGGWRFYPLEENKTLIFYEAYTDIGNNFFNLIIQTQTAPTIQNLIAVLKVRLKKVIKNPSEFNL